MAMPWPTLTVPSELPQADKPRSASVKSGMSALVPDRADGHGGFRTGLELASAYSGRAWIWATCPDAACRNGARAVESATTACERTLWRDASHLSVLAASYAESGDFASAVKWQTKAIELVADPKQKDEYHSRLKVYQEKKPCRDTRRE